MLKNTKLQRTIDKVQKSKDSKCDATSLEPNKFEGRKQGLWECKKRIKILFVLNAEFFNFKAAGTVDKLCWHSAAIALSCTDPFALRGLRWRATYGTDKEREEY